MSAQSFCRPPFLKRGVNRGTILLLAIGAVATLSILALGVTSSVMQELRLSRYVTDENASFLSALSCLEIVTFGLRGDASGGDTLTLYDMKPKTVVLGDRTLTIDFIDEARFIDVMSTTPEILGRVPGLEGNTELINKLKTTELSFIEEIRFLDGMTPGIFEAIKPYVTVSRQMGVNINTASPEIFEALGMDADLVARIISFRAGSDGQEGTADDGVFYQPGEILKTMEEESLSVSQQELLITLTTSGQLITKSNRIRYLITVSKGRYARKYEAVVYVPTVGIISWQDRGVEKAARGTWS
jgi:hypothetical protein